MAADVFTGWGQLGLAESHLELWRSAGFDAPTTALWLGHDFDVFEAAVWRSAGWGAGGARAWRGAGIADPVLARQYERAGLAPAEAARDRRTGGTPPAMASDRSRGPQELAAAKVELALAEVPRGFDRGRVYRESVGRDLLFGSPRSAAGFDAWVSSIGGRSNRITPLSDLRMQRVAAWQEPDRLTARDAHVLRDALVVRAARQAWSRPLASLAQFAVPVLVDPVEAAGKIHAEDPPGDLLPAVRLPFDTVLLLFGAPFQILDADLRGLPGWDPGADRAGLGYEPWLAHVSQLGGAVAGVVLIAGAGRAGLADSCAWVLRVQGEYVLIPSCRSASALDSLTQNLAAALCFGSWVRDVPRASTRQTQRSPAPSGTRARTTSSSTAPGGVHEVRVRPSARSSGGGGTGRSARAPHVRRGHWKRVRVGPRHNWAYEFRWIAPTSVNGSVAIDRPGVVYRLPRVI